MKNSSIVFLGLMMLLFLAVPNAAAATENNASKLTVQGDGKVTASPDMATIVLGVETQNASAAGAVREMPV